MAFTDFNKLMLKLSENVTKPQPHDTLEDRPGSPFIVLLSEESEAHNEISNSPKEHFENDFFNSPLSSTNIQCNSIDSSCGNLSSLHDVDDSFELEEDIDYEEIQEEPPYSPFDSDISQTEIQNTDKYSDNLFKEDAERSHRRKPLSRNQFEQLFDDCGRLVNEHEMRRAIFKGGVEDDIRKDVWKFLFELYPFNSTARERESIHVEQLVRYEAMKIRWKKLLKTLVNDYEGVSYCPKWYTGCLKNDSEFRKYEAELSRSNEEDNCEQLESVKAVESKSFSLSNNACEVQIESNNSEQEKGDIESDYCVNEVSKTESFDVNDTNDVVLSNNTNTEIKNKNSNQMKINTVYESNHTNSNTDLSLTNNCSRTRTESLNFECHAVDSLSEALADAMLETESKQFMDDCFDNIDGLDFPKHINSQESLYSKSENIKSVDLTSYGENINKNDNFFNTEPIVETIDNSPKISDSHYIDETPKDFHESVVNETDDEIAQLTNAKPISPDHLSVTDTADSLSRSRVVKTPTGEEIDTLPPWIAQIINSDNSFKPIPNKSANNVMSQKNLYSPDQTVSFHKDLCKNGDVTPSKSNNNVSHLSSNKELLGIVENANRYLQEQMKHLSPVSPQTKQKSSKTKKPVISHESFNSSNTTTVGKTRHLERDDNIIMSPIREKEHSFFIDSPKFKFISERSKKDVTDGMKSSISMLKCPYCHFAPEDDLLVEMPKNMGEEQLKFMGIQAQVFAARQPYQVDLVSSSIRVIDKDVPRTDRELSQFTGDDNPGLLKLRDALLTYAFFHPEVGYAQGMNDIMSRFLFVADNECDAYWMFVNYMEHFKNDFMEAGMLRKIVLVEQLLMKMDRELYEFLQSTDIGLMFCHRWLLLNFKREFSYIEAIRLFEITSSRHLEVSSVEAELERARERARDFLHERGGGSHLEEIYMSPEYPFDIFVCVAMLIECRSMIMGTSDLNSVYQVLSNLPKSMDIQDILRRSEELFYQFCRKSVVDCFQVIDELEVEDFRKKKSQFFFNVK